MNNYILHIYSMTYEAGLPERAYMNRTQEGYSLRYFAAGRGRVVIEDVTYPVKPGTFFFISPGVRFGEISDFEEPMSEYHISFYLHPLNRKNQSKDFLIFREEEHKLLQPFFYSKFQVFKCESPHESEHILCQVAHELISQRPGYLTKLSLMYPQIFINAARALSIESNNSYTEPFTPLTVYKGHSISDVMRNNIADITLEYLADELKISSRQLQRDIRKYFSMSFKDLLTFMRLEYAKEMLVKTEFAIPEIAHTVGLNCSSYFYKVFREHEKVTPCEYRKHNKNKLTFNIYIKS